MASTPVVLVTPGGNFLHDPRHPSTWFCRTGRLEWVFDGTGEGVWLCHPNSLPFGHTHRCTWN